MSELFPEKIPARVFLTHTRPEPILGIPSCVHTGAKTAGLGFRNDGGTLNVGGMLWVNGCSWVHCLRAAASVLNDDESAFLNDRERSALNGHIAPDEIIDWLPGS